MFQETYDDQDPAHKRPPIHPNSQKAQASETYEAEGTFLSLYNLYLSQIYRPYLSQMAQRNRSTVNIINQQRVGRNIYTIK